MTFGPAREKLLANRRIFQIALDGGFRPKLRFPVLKIQPNWTIQNIPPDLLDRRVEITGPASNKKMVINALNSGAQVYMADAEDSECPTWKNIINGQLNLYEAVRRTITYEGNGKLYQLNREPAVLMFRPRGLHLQEKHVLVDGKPVSASLFD